MREDVVTITVKALLRHGANFDVKGDGKLVATFCGNDYSFFAISVGGYRR